MSLLPSVASQHPYRVALGAGGALGTAAVVAALVSSAASSPQVAAAAPAPPAAPASMALPAAPEVLPEPAPPPAPEVHSSQLMFVFQAGGATYMKLADLRMLDEEGEALPIPRHGKLRLSKDHYIDAAIATVPDPAVPAMHLVWKDRKVKVDNGCEASVVGFAVVSRLVGDPAYADPGYSEGDQWTATGVMKAGHTVLAARLDRCTGTFARDATLPDVVVPTPQHDAALEAEARAQLIASAPARDTQREWDEQQTATGGEAGPWHKDATIATQVLRDPRTGVTFVSAHGHVSAGCGAPHANLWGLFRVEGRTLVPVQLRQLGNVESIDALIDVDGDGELEILGKDWLGYDMLLTHAGGEPIDQLSVPFLGCPC
jgi:hypothetical protein